MRAQLANLLSGVYGYRLQTMRLSLAMVFSRTQRRYHPRRSTNNHMRFHKRDFHPEDRDEFAQGVDTRRWQKGIQNLDEDLFRPLSYYLDGYKIHEIAEYLQQSPSMIEQKINEAKKTLKEMDPREVSAD